MQPRLAMAAALVFYMMHGAALAQTPTVGIWKDTAAGAAGNPDAIGAALAAAGLGVRFLSTRDLTDPAVVNPQNLALLVLPYGESFPASGSASLRAFLRGGGSLITLGGRCFREPLFSTPDGWANRAALCSRYISRRPVANITPALVEALRRDTAKGQDAAEVSLTKDAAGNPALRVTVPQLKTYTYVALGGEGAGDAGVVHFRARGDQDTNRLCVELNEADGSRWKAVVELSPDWKTYDVLASEFVCYASEHRGDKGDYVRPEQVRRVLFGFPASLVGTGPRTFEASEVEWRTVDAPARTLLDEPLLLAAPSDLERAFGPRLKYPGGAGDIAAFHGSRPFTETEALRSAPGQVFFPADFVITGASSGWTATILDDDLYAIKRDKARARYTFLPTQRLVRAAPLLLTSKGETAASLFVNTGGTYAGSVWACFGATNRDLFPPGDNAALVSLADRMLNGAFFTEITPRFTVRDGGVVMQAAVGVSNRAFLWRRLVIEASLSGTTQIKAATTVELSPRQTAEFIALEVGADRFDWKDFRAECRLLLDGKCLDIIQTSVNVRDTLLTVCDLFVRTQQERGDGKFSGIGFVDNRGARGLLAAHDLTGRKEHLDAAMSWGNAMIAEQRADGGYLMGYGYHPEGNECFVADGGEIACGVARLVTYVSEKEKGRYYDSLKAYMGYRESFRCEGGGIGVGWCKSDYGSRPIKPLDKVVKIFAPEENIYTIGCTLTAAVMHALLTKDPKDNEAAVRDARWWMSRCKSTTGGAFVESAVWGNKFLQGENIRKETEDFLRTKFIPNVIGGKSRWWTTSEGRTVQGLDGLAYFHDCIEKTPDVLAELMRVTYNVCSPEALSGIPHLLSRPNTSGAGGSRKKLTDPEWFYLNFSAVSLPDLLRSEIIRKPF